LDHTKDIKTKKEKKKSRLLKTPIKRRVDNFPKKIDVYYIVLEPETEDNQT